MTTALEIFTRYTEAMGRNDVDAAVACYTEDGTLDFPFWPLLGLKGGYTGHEDLHAYLTKLQNLVPGFHFIDFQTHIDTPDAFFGECRVDLPTSTGRRFNFKYGMLVLAENGKIKLLREFIDQIPAAAALLPDGVNEIMRMKLD